MKTELFDHHELMTKLYELNSFLPRERQIVPGELMMIGFAFGVVEAIHHEREKEKKTTEAPPTATEIIARIAALRVWPEGGTSDDELWSDAKKWLDTH